MTPREQRWERRKWQCRWKLCRQKKKELTNFADENGVSSTLPATTQNRPSTPRATSSANSACGRKCIQRNRSALHRENLNLRQQLQQTHTLVERYKKRLQLSLKTKRNANTPRKLTKVIISVAGQTLDIL